MPDHSDPRGSAATAATWLPLLRVLASSVLLAGLLAVPLVSAASPGSFRTQMELAKFSGGGSGPGHLFSQSVPIWPRLRPGSRSSGQWTAVPWP